MADMGSIAAAISGLKTAAEIAKGFLDLKEAAAVQGKVIELQGVILAAQSSALAAQSDQMSLLDEVRTLKEKMAKLEAWEAEKNRYKLTDYGGGTFAYGLKTEAQGSEPPHRLCAHCYNDGHKSILQFSSRSEGQDYYDCLRCKSRQAFGRYRQIPDGGGGYYREDYDD